MMKLLLVVPLIHAVSATIPPQRNFAKRDVYLIPRLTIRSKLPGHDANRIATIPFARRYF